MLLPSSSSSWSAAIDEKFLSKSKQCEMMFGFKADDVSIELTEKYVISLEFSLNFIIGSNYFNFAMAEITGEISH